MMNNKGLKVCFFIGNLYQGGIGKLTIHLAEEFLKKGVNVDFVLIKQGGELLNQVPEEVRVFVYEGSLFSRFRKFLTYLRTEQPDVSVSARAGQNVFNVLCCTLAGKVSPVISSHTNLSVENMLDDSKKEDGIFRKLLFRFVYKIPDKIIAVSKGVADDLAKRTGVQKDKIKLIYNPVYKPYVEEQAPNDIPIAFERLLKSGRKFIIGVGRLTEAKDFFSLIRAFNILKQKLDLALVILGEGPLRKELEGLIAELGLEESVFLLGYVSEPRYYVKRAEAFVSSSLWEGFPLAPVEALGVGTPIVSTNCPSGPDEILEGGKYGRLVPVADPEKLAQAIVETLGEERKSDVLIERARDFSTTKIAEEYLAYLFD